MESYKIVLYFKSKISKLFVVKFVTINLVPTFFICSGLSGLGLESQKFMAHF